MMLLIGWFWFPRDADVTLRRETQLTMARDSTAFSSGLADSSIRCYVGRENKLIFIRVWEIHNLMWDSTNPVDINRPR